MPWVAASVLLASCSLIASPDSSPTDESSEARCHDGIDQDLDGEPDCADPQCAAFCPLASAVEVGVGACREGWTPTTTTLGATVCEPFPLGRRTCSDRSILPPGSIACVELDCEPGDDLALPEGAVPDGAPGVDVDSRYVDPVAPLGGDGSRERPFQTVYEAVASFPATDGSLPQVRFVILLEGTHVVDHLPGGFVYRGACGQDVRLIPAFAPSDGSAAPGRLELGAVDGPMDLFPCAEGEFPCPLGFDCLLDQRVCMPAASEFDTLENVSVRGSVVVRSPSGVRAQRWTLSKVWIDSIDGAALTLEPGASVIVRRARLTGPEAGIDVGGGVLNVEQSIVEGLGGFAIDLQGFGPRASVSDTVLVGQSGVRIGCAGTFDGFGVVFDGTTIAVEADCADGLEAGSLMLTQSASIVADEATAIAIRQGYGHLAVHDSHLVGRVEVSDHEGSTLVVSRSVIEAFLGGATGTPLFDQHGGEVRLGETQLVLTGNGADPASRSAVLRLGKGSLSANVVELVGNDEEWDGVSIDGGDLARLESFVIRGFGGCGIRLATASAITSSAAVDPMTGWTGTLERNDTGVCIADGIAAGPWLTARITYRDNGQLVCTPAHDANGDCDTVMAP